MKKLNAAERQERQEKLFRFIVDYKMEHDGTSPSFNEMTVAVGMEKANHSTLKIYLENLERAAAAVPRILRLCWAGPLTIEDMLLKQGFDSPKSRERYKAACSALAEVGLLSFGRDGWEVVKPIIQRLSKLAGA